MCSLDKFRRRYGLHINFLNYIIVTKCVKKFIGDNRIDNNFQLIWPYIPFHMKLLLASHKISKGMYIKFVQIDTICVEIKTEFATESALHYCYVKLNLQKLFLVNQ